ncbi:MAG: hypothetical protein HC810_05260, partial [Acaryochloridaceae cyanobacterium RL_2_7]|nr:hypothetical protein [Acaryochloridaceae cyanobacterium RL_2_7]
PMGADFQGAEYGFDVAVEGAMISFGLRRQVQPAIWNGAVGVARRESTWQSAEIIAPPEGEAMINFGVSTDIANHTLIAAAPRSGSYGMAYRLNLEHQTTWEPFLTDQAIPPNGWLGGQVSLSSHLAFLGGDRGAPIESASAIVSLSQGDGAKTRYITPGGIGVVHKDVAVVAIARPKLLTPFSTPPKFDDSPTVKIVDGTGIRSIRLKNPETHNRVSAIQALAMNDDFVVFSQPDNSEENLRCKVFVMDANS